MIHFLFSLTVIPDMNQEYSVNWKRWFIMTTYRDIVALAHLRLGPALWTSTSVQSCTVCLPKGDLRTRAHIFKDTQDSRFRNCICYVHIQDMKGNKKCRCSVEICERKWKGRDQNQSIYNVKKKQHVNKGEDKVVFNIRYASITDAISFLIFLL